MPEPLPDPQAPPLLRGQFTSPGDHPYHTDEFDVRVHVNRDGFVDREWGPKAGPRVIVIGDSFVQAAQVPLDDGFPRVLDALLPDAEVLAMGIPGAGTATALDVLDTYALPRKPDLVLLGFLSANDVLNNHPLLDGKDDKPYYRLDGGRLLRTSSAIAAAPRGWLWTHANLARWIGRLVAEKRLAANKVALGEGVPIDFRVYDPGAGPLWEEAWAITDALLGEVVRHCGEVPVGVVVFPDGFQATQTGRDRMVAAWPAAAGWDTRAPHTRAVAMAQTHAPTLDLLPTFDRREDAYLRLDAHWSAAGNHLAAEAVAPFAARLLSRSATPRGQIR